MEEKKYAASFLGNLLAAPLNIAMQKVTAFEESHGSGTTRHLMAQLIHLGSEHLKAIHASKQEGVARENTLDPREFYSSTSTSILNLLFPRGAEDLTFIPEELRDQAWAIFRDTLMPTLLQSGLESFLSPVNVSKLMLKILELTRDNLNGEIVDAEEMDADPELVAAMGAFLTPLLQNLELPEAVRSRLLDPGMTATLGLALTRQLSDTFIQEKMALGLKTAVERDFKGEHLIQFSKVHAVDRDAVDAAAMVELNEKLSSVSRELVDAGISNWIRSSYFEFKKSFDGAVRRLFGEGGVRIKHALGSLFEFIFCTLIGTVLGFLFWPVKRLAKAGIYRYIGLDHNRNAVMHLLTDLPKGAKHAVVHEDLIFKMVNEIKNTGD